jgi:MFS family permease
LCFALPQSLVIPVLPHLQGEYNTDQTTVTWVMTAHLLSAYVATPLVGRLGDALGKKRILVLTLAALAFGSLMAAAAPNIGWVIAGRAVQGISGGVLPLAIGIVREQVKGRVSMALGALFSLSAAGFGLGIVVAGPIVGALGYQGLFWIPMAAASITAAAAALILPDSGTRTYGRPPLLAVILLAAWLVALLLGLSEGNSWGWSSPRTVGVLTAALLMAAFWIRIEARAHVPLVDMRMMADRGVWTANLISFCVGVGLFSSFAFLPRLWQTSPDFGYGLGASVTESGYLLLPSAVMSFLGGIAPSTVLRVWGARFVMAAALLVTSAALASVAYFDDNMVSVLVVMTVYGLGVGLAYSTLVVVVVASVPAHQTSVASGMNANVRTIGGCIGVAVSAAIIAAGTDVEGFPAEQGFRMAFLTLAGVSAFAVLPTLLLPDVRNSAQRAE